MAEERSSTWWQRRSEEGHSRWSKTKEEGNRWCRVSSIGRKGWVQRCTITELVGSIELTNPI